MMDDVDLPPVPPSARKAAHTPPPRPSLFLTRKRTHTDYDDDIATSSDPALFSSDEHAPDAENYVTGKRKKHTYKGSWWEHQHVKSANEKKREFSRNFDSGVFMGSETSDEALSSDSFGLEDELLRDQQREQDKPRGTKSSRLFTIESVETTPKAKVVTRPAASATSIEHAEVCLIIRQALDEGKEDVDLSSMSLSTLPSEVSSLQTLSKQAEIVPGMLDVGTDLEAKLRLYLANNLFIQFPTPILDLRNLRVLSLRQNNLTSIPPTIRELVHLESLNVAGNQLQELPFEIVELVKFHRLRIITLQPNPWIQFPCEEGDGCKVVKHEVFRSELNSNDPSLHRRHPVDLQSRSKNRNPKIVYTSTAPSLAELALRKLSQVDPLSRIDFRELMPADAPQSVLKDLELLKSLPGRRCTRCHRPIVLAAEEWVEWWSLTRGRSISMAEWILSIDDEQDWETFLPFRRLLCSARCGEQKNSWCDYDEPATQWPLRLRKENRKLVLLSA